MWKENFRGWLARGDGYQRFAKMFLFAFVFFAGLHSAERLVTHFWHVDYLHEPITSFQFWLHCVWLAAWLSAVFTMWPPGKKSSETQR